MYCCCIEFGNAGKSDAFLYVLNTDGTMETNETEILGSEEEITTDGTLIHLGNYCA
jgi:hypothetical protein